MRLALLASLLLLTACSSPAQRALRNSPDFKAGYADGCASASQEGADKREQSLVRDEPLYAGNAAYHSGWGSGFSTCRAMSASRAPTGDPLAMPKTP